MSAHPHVETSTSRRPEPSPELLRAAAVAAWYAALAQTYARELGKPGVPAPPAEYLESLVRGDPCTAEPNAATPGDSSTPPPRSP